MCGKHIFLSQTDAAIAIHGINRDKKQDRLSKTYYCDQCKGWHISSKRKRKPSKMQREDQEVNYKVKTDNKSKRGNLNSKLFIRNFTSKGI